MSFDGCWAKVGWAKRHRDFIDACISQTLDAPQNRATVGVRYEPETGENIVYVSSVPEIGDLLTILGLAFGDAIHSLRGALDHLVYEVAVQRTHGPMEAKWLKVQAWPFSKDGIAWKADRGHQLHYLAEDDWAKIERHQRHKRLPQGLPPGHQRDGFALLRDLDDMQKHRLLLPVWWTGAGVSNPHPAAAGIFLWHVMSQLNNPEPWEIRPVELGAVIARMRLPDDLPLAPMDMAGYVASNVALGSEWPRFNLVELLDRFAELVSAAIREFDPQAFPSAGCSGARRYRDDNRSVHPSSDGHRDECSGLAKAASCVAAACRPLSACTSKWSADDRCS